jgi:predicted DNA-binding antitoxin AbrB/MazE fold protein
MSVIVEATYQNGAFKSVEPVSLPEGTKVRLVITPVADQDALVGQGTTTAESSEQGRPTPVFIWSKALYRARKAAQEFTRETHADY